MAVEAGEYPEPSAHSRIPAEPPVCATYYSRLWGYNREEDGQKSLPSWS